MRTVSIAALAVLSITACSKRIPITSSSASTLTDSSAAITEKVRVQSYDTIREKHIVTLRLNDTVAIKDKVFVTLYDTATQTVRLNMLGYTLVRYDTIRDAVIKERLITRTDTVYAEIPVKTPLNKTQKILISIGVITIVIIILLLLYKLLSYITRRRIY